MCIAARSFDYPRKSAKGRGKKISISPTIKIGLISSNNEIKTLMPQRIKDCSKDVLAVCSKCHQCLGKGLSHRCLIKQSASNILNTIDTLPDQVTDTIVSGLLKKKADSTYEISSTAKQKNVPFQLATEGSKSRVILNPKIKNPVEISHENLHDLQIGLGNLSETKMKKVTNWVRTQVGRKSIPDGYKDTKLRRVLY